MTKSAENLSGASDGPVRPVRRAWPPCAARSPSRCPWGVPINLALFAVYMAGTMLGACLGHGQPARVHCAGRHRCAGAGWFPGRPLCHLWQDRRLCAGLHSGCTHHRVDLTKALGRKFWSLCVAMVVGCAVCYVLGTIWFMTLTGADLASALGWCVLPYLPGDVIKIALAAILTIQLDKRMPNL